MPSTRRVSASTTTLFSRRRLASDLSIEKLSISTPRSHNLTEEAKRIGIEPVASIPVLTFERPRAAPSPLNSKAWGARITHATVITGETSGPAVPTQGVERGSHVANHEEAWQAMWERNDLPNELSMTQNSTSHVVRDVVTESLNNAKALRASKLDFEDTLGRCLKDQGCSNVLSQPLESTPQVQGSLKISKNLIESSTSENTSSSNSPDTSSCARHSVESFTTAESSGDHPLADLPGHAASSNTSLGATTLETRKEDGKHFRRHGIMKLFWSKEDKGKSVSREPLSDGLSTAPSTLSTKECASCFDDVPSKNAISLTCQHSYCSECFSHLVTTAIQHENFWPPKCCLQDISKNILEKNLSSLQLANYRLKALEYSIPAGERWYCAKPECGKWFNKSKTRARDATVLCSHCNFAMCMFCRGTSHPAGELCRQDRGLEATLAAADLEGWRRCYNCHTMVELNTGCRHITCKCKAEFCYTCGARWRSCSCNEADDIRRRADLAVRRLVTNQEANEIQAAIEAVAQAEQQEREQAEAEEARLREATEREERERVQREEARLAEEMQQIEKMETERVENITVYFDCLRTAMASLHKVQERAIQRRHTQQRNDTQQELEAVALEEATRVAEKTPFKYENEETWKMNREKQARQIIETAIRHRDDQDKYFSLFKEPVDGEAVDVIIQAQKFEELAREQDSERATLRDMHRRELRRLYNRLRDTHAEEITKQRESLQQRKQAATQAVSQLERHSFSDLKWFEHLVMERAAMLDEDEHRLINSGADAPTIDVGTSSSAELLSIPEIPTPPFRPRRAAERSAIERRPRTPVSIEWVEAQ